MRKKHKTKPKKIKNKECFQALVVVWLKKRRGVSGLNTGFIWNFHRFKFLITIYIGALTNSHLQAAVHLARTEFSWTAVLHQLSGPGFQRRMFPS
jgi:hypothetical protein